MLYNTLFRFFKVLFFIFCMLTMYIFAMHKCKDSFIHEQSFERNVGESSFIHKQSLRTKIHNHAPKHPCNLSVVLNDTLWVAVTSYKDKRGLHRALTNIESQSQLGSFANVRVIVYEDVSDELMSAEEKKRFTTVFLQRWTTRNMGSAYAKYRIFNYIQRVSNPNDYVMVMDGDDVLSHDGVLQYIHKEILKHKPWFMWGRIRGKFEEQCGPLPVKTSKIREFARDMKRQVWPVCHPRIFKSHLLNLMDEMDFRNANNQWLQKSTDRPFMFAFLEYSGDHRVHFLSEQQIYNYTWTPNNGLLRFSSKVIALDRSYVNKQAIRKLSPIYIDIITCMWDRRTEKEFFSSIMQSTLRDNHVIRLHVCNNKPELQYERENLARKFKHITVYNMRTNTFGFGRFILAKKIMRDLLIDYIIMVDDDMFVENFTLQNVFDSRRPRTYSSWYGKNWDISETNYWKPLHQLSASNPYTALQQFPLINTWQYGGTGMSIIDATIFSSDLLFKCPQKYLNVEDMWLSYVVQLLKWDIRRLKVTFTLNFQENMNGQWSTLQDKKNNVFRDLGYLRCSSNSLSTRNT